MSAVGWWGVALIVLSLSVLIGFHLGCAGLQVFHPMGPCP